MTFYLYTTSTRNFKILKRALKSITKVKFSDNTKSKVVEGLLLRTTLFHFEKTTSKTPCDRPYRYFKARKPKIIYL